MRDWLVGYVPPASKYMEKLRDAATGRDTVKALQMRLQTEPGNPEVRIKLGRKYQERNDRNRALTLFLEAANLDPKGSVMTRTDDGALVSCRDMAEFQHARTYIITSGLIDSERVRKFIRSHPASPLLRDAYLEADRFLDLSDTGDRAFFGEILDRIPHDPGVLSRLEQTLTRLRDKITPNPVLDAVDSYAEKTMEWLQKSSPMAAAKTLADLRVLKGDSEQIESAYGPDIVAGQVHAWALSLLDYAEFWRIQKRNDADALAAVRLALILRPDEAGLHQAAARVYLLSPARMEEALASYGPTWLKAAERPADDLYDYFSFWMNRNANRDSALAVLDDVLARNPDSLYYRRAAATVLWRVGDKERTQDVFGPTYASSHPDRLSLLYEYGMFWLERKTNLDTAIPALVKAASDPGQYWMNRWRAAEALDGAGKAAEAESVFGPSSLENFAGDAMALNAYADFWTRRQTNPQTVLRAIEMIESLPRLEWSDRNRVASHYLKMGRKDKAEAVYGPAYMQTILSDAQELVFYARFWVYNHQNLFSAMDAARAAVRQAPAYAAGWAVLADLLQIEGKAAEALQAIDKAVSLAGGAEEREQYQRRRADIAGTAPKRAG